jgi:glucan phosphoethanolaminetransferase (alkaline phosphatase superfamily)
MLEIFLENIFIKIAILSYLIYLFIKLHGEYKNLGLINLSLFFIVLIISIITLEILAFPVVYPYGLVLEFIIIYFAATILLILFSVVKNRVILITSSFLLLIILTVIPLCYVFHLLIFQSTLQTDTFYAIFQTDWIEMKDFIQQFIPFYSYLILATMIYLLFKIIYKSSSLFIQRKTNYRLIILHTTIIMGILWIIPKDNNLYLSPFYAFQNYTHSLALFKQNTAPVSNFLELNTLKLAQKQQGNLHLIVIGESSNKHHMSLYNYSKKTTPKLDALSQKNNLIVFKHAFSNHTTTLPALSLALTSANQINQQSLQKAHSIIRILKAINSKTAWLSNQRRYGIYDNLISLLSNDSDATIYINEAVGDDEIKVFDSQLLEPLKKTINNWDKKTNLVIFLHLIGNHSLYKERYPKEFEKFKTPFVEVLIDSIKNGLGITQQNTSEINHYDNSILFTDFVISRFIEHIEKLNLTSTLLYFADHGEDVNRGIAHNPTQFTYDMVEIPLIIWVSEKYRKQYPKKVQALQLNRNKLFSNDLIFDTLIGLYDIPLKQFYNPRFDLSNSHYNLKDNEALTLHGKIPYVSDKNLFYP